MDEQQIEVALDGGTLVGHRGGDGLPALFLHGGPGLPDYMGTCAELLADRFAYVRYTQRGVAPSAEVPPYTIETHVSDAIRVLDAAGLERAWLVGHSWGGHLALHVYASHPDRVLGLVCIDPLGASGEFLAAFGENLRRSLTPEQAARVDEIEARRRSGEATVDELKERGMLIWPAYFVDLGIAIRNAPRRVGVECSTEANRSIGEHHAASTLVERLPKAPGCPALFVHGTEDPMPRESSIATAELIPDAQVVLIEGSGHYPWLECPDAFRDAVVTWLEGRTS